MGQEQQRRLELDALLNSFLPPEGKAYFQPGANVTLEYPCITYQRDYIKPQFADNLPYLHAKRYLVTVIDRDPDSEIPDKVAAMPYSLFNRFFIADGLNHDVFNVYF